MDSANKFYLEKTACITVTYNPDLTVLGTQLSQLPQSGIRIIVDNASAPKILVSLRAMAEKYDVRLVVNARNMGLAAASNQGISVARQFGADSVLLLDQDTEPGIDGVMKLAAAYQRLLLAGKKPGCIGPRLIDVTTGLQHGFHQIRGWRWVRRFPAADEKEVIDCANLNGSGTLIPALILEKVGGLEEDFFIDHVDTEWAFRVLSRGFGLYGAPDVSFRQRMGERGLRFWWLGWRVWPQRSPGRHYYLFRNAVSLLMRDYVPRVWKCWAVIKLGMTALVHVVFDSQRQAQIRCMLKGVRDGFQMRRDRKNMMI